MNSLLPVISIDDLPLNSIDNLTVPQTTPGEAVADFGVPPADLIVASEAVEPRSSIGRMAASLGEFFHGTEVPYGLALMRISLSITVFIFMAYRWSYAREIFSTDGAGISLWSIYGYPFSWLEPSGGAAVAINSIVLLALVSTCIGWCTRPSLILATGGYTYLTLLDILGTLNKSSAIASHLLFFLCFSRCGAVWSVDSWLRRTRLLRRGVPRDQIPGPERAPVWPRRLMQILVAAVYVSAAVTKLQTRAYFTGEHLQTWMITTYHTPNLFGHLLALQPALVILCAYVTILWELLFAFLIWRRGFRGVMLTLGAGFHVMTCLTLALFIFPMICLCSYFAFGSQTDYERIGRVLGRGWQRISGWFGIGAARWSNLVIRKLPVLSPASSRGIFAAAVLLTGVGGVALEYKLDRYGVRRPQGPYELKELDHETASALLTPTQPIQNEDKVFNFDVGTLLVNGAIIDRRTTFYQGEVVRAQCGLMPPHETMWLQCNLHDSKDRVVDTVGLFISGEMMRALFYYNLGDCLMPGDYSLVLKIAGEEVMRRQITVLPRAKACLAN